MTIVPITLKQANAFISAHHRHAGPTRGHRFSIGLNRGDELVGVAVAGRPVARGLDDGLTLEVTRLCVVDAPNGCSQLLGAIVRAAKELSR